MSHFFWAENHGPLVQTEAARSSGTLRSDFEKLARLGHAFNPLFKPGVAYPDVSISEFVGRLRKEFHVFGFSRQSDSETWMPRHELVWADGVVLKKKVINWVRLTE
jgi:hypothetical protein